MKPDPLIPMVPTLKDFAQDLPPYPSGMVSTSSKGDVTFFNRVGDVVGKMDFSSGELRFEGKADDAATVFLQHFARQALETAQGKRIQDLETWLRSGETRIHDLETENRRLIEENEKLISDRSRGPYATPDELRNEIAELRKQTLALARELGKQDARLEQLQSGSYSSGDLTIKGPFRPFYGNGDLQFVTTPCSQTASQLP